MPRALKLAAVLALVALLPLRAVASATLGFCASGHEVAATSAHGTGGHSHQGAKSPAQPTENSANICVEHCSSAVLAISADPALDAWAPVRDRALFTARNSPAFFPDPLDRPPLA